MSLLNKRFIEHFRNVVQIHKDINDITNFHCLDDEWENAYIASQRAEMIADHLTLMDISDGLHEILLFRGRIEEADNLHRRAVAASRMLGSKHRIAIALLHFGSICDSLGRTEEALAAYSESLSILEGLGLSVEIARVLNNLGTLVEHQGQHEYARRNYERSLALARQSESPSIQAVVLFNLGLLDERERGWHAALPRYHESLNISRATGDRLGEAQTLVTLADHFALIGNWTEAESSYRQALETYRQYKANLQVHRILQALTEVRRAQGDASTEPHLQHEAESFPESENQAKVDFSKLMSLELFVALADKSHSLRTGDKSLVPEHRILLAFQAVFENKDNMLVLLPIVRRQDREEMLIQFVSWLIQILRPFQDESADSIELLEGGPLSFIRHDQPSAGWHNLKAEFGRWALEKTLTMTLFGRFPHWNEEETRTALQTIPPLSVLNRQFNPTEETAQLDLPFEFLLDFLSSSYLIHLGHDPVLRVPPTEEGQYDDGFWGRIQTLLAAHLPRHLEEPYVQHFRKVRDREPFAVSFTNAAANLRRMGWDDELIEETLMAVTFPYSLLHAHQIVSASDRDFLFESESRRSYYSSLVTAQYGLHLKRFRGADRWSDGDLVHFVFQIPTVTEMWGISSSKWKTPMAVRSVEDTDS
jgi:tetratricopeptide (TPR) repeat protein